MSRLSLEAGLNPRYFAATAKQAWPRRAPQAAEAAERDSNGPTCRRVTAPAGT